MIASRPDVRPLAGLSWSDRETAGVKAATLGELSRAGFPVPEGFVLTTATQRHFLSANRLDEASPAEAILSAPFPDDLAETLLVVSREFGQATVAVRSSAVAEDLPDASFAGQYETVLDVRGSDAIGEAVKHCWASAAGERVHTYAGRSGEPAPSGVAVLIQRMVPADSAGVAFTADPLTGNRDDVVIEAVRGLGEKLVSGQSDGDQWVVRGSSATCRRSTEAALTSEQAVAVAVMARDVERHRGAPQDVEWAFSAAGELFLLQARPMTALVEAADWTPPVPGGWMRNFRFGEWLPDPVTTLFETWILPRIDRSLIATGARLTGIRSSGPTYVIVNGWCFANPAGRASTLGFMVQALAHLRVMRALALQFSRPAIADAMLVRPLERKWREDVLPRYRDLVASGEEVLASSNPAETVRFVDGVADLVGEYWSMFTFGGGSAWKLEAGLARFYRRHLWPVIGGSHQELLWGLDAPTARMQPHLVQSLDWVAPTLGDLAIIAAVETDGSRTARLRASRIACESRCREALAGQKKLLRQFEELLDYAQHYAVLREEQCADLTLGWPVIRRAAIQLGEALRQRGAIDAAEDVFFLTLDELNTSLTQASSPSISTVVAGRRREWERRRKLTPPLVVGRLPGFFSRMLNDSLETMRVPTDAVSGAIRGLPASPGRARGPVRIIRGNEDFGKFRRGDILVTQAAMPAWTPLFMLAAAVITDTGTMAAHASLVAREVGIPAVVGTGDATDRLHDDQVVTVDGGAGLVEVEGRADTQTE
ncbi:MAG TPA: PEP/pyruvate-binding domain-containing protein [Candidatus Dormibacteraeota bacterium]|nr:PEP/pyruvate-binding domain-containing protein [Candidatus Dormibacteraeota bacterium]